MSFRKLREKKAENRLNNFEDRIKFSTCLMSLYGTIYADLKIRFKIAVSSIAASIFRGIIDNIRFPVLKSPALLRAQSSETGYYPEIVYFSFVIGALIYVIQFVAAIRTLRIDVMTITERGSVFLFSKHRPSSCIRGSSWLSLLQEIVHPDGSYGCTKRRDLRRYIKIYFSLFLLLLSSPSSELFYGDRE